MSTTLLITQVFHRPRRMQQDSNLTYNTSLTLVSKTPLELGKKFDLDQVPWKYTGIIPQELLPRDPLATGAWPYEYLCTLGDVRPHLSGASNAGT